MQVTMRLKKETRGTVVYTEVTEDEPQLGTLYIPKRSVASPWPKTITVTIEFEAANGK